SDRKEDYRTEILGLMKAQKVKNAVIVPDGSKGGFVLKRIPALPEDLKKEVSAQYVTFMQGLLDLTDNLVDGTVVHPPDVRVLDDDDPYLVVAADKGTAAFSDTANAVSAAYGFWLGDAFASGGSAGYDRKAKTIVLSPEARAALGVSPSAAQEMTPAEVVKTILKAPVDLFWNGGIGTYVKSTKESNADVGDRTNDPVRVAGKDLRCR